MEHHARVAETVEQLMLTLNYQLIRQSSKSIISLPTLLRPWSRICPSLYVGVGAGVFIAFVLGNAGHRSEPGQMASNMPSVIMSSGPHRLTSAAPNMATHPPPAFFRNVSKKQPGGLNSPVLQLMENTTGKALPLLKVYISLNPNSGACQRLKAPCPLYNT